MASFVEEVLRLHPPVQFRSRVAVAPDEVAGCTVAPGTAVLPLVGAANRDPSRYEAPGEVNLSRRAPRDHFALHFGIRQCVGAAIARAEILKSVLAALARLPELSVDPDRVPPEFGGWLLRAYAPLHVRFSPGPTVSHGRLERARDQHR